APASPGTTDAGSPSDQEQPVCGVARLLGVRVTEIFQESPELLHLAGRNLHADQHPAVVGAVVAVVEQADVPVAAHAREKAHQRAGPLGELEAVEQLVPRERRAPAEDRKSTRLNSSHLVISYAVFCLKKKKMCS